MDYGPTRERQLIKEELPAQIIFLTMHADESFVAEVFRCGGSGYLLKQSAGEEQITAIRISLLQKH